mgnify:CR=1 FL=1
MIWQIRQELQGRAGCYQARYQEIIDGLQLDLDLVDEFKTIEKNFKAKAGSNYAASRGEYLNGIIMANYLGYDFIDAATVIFFDENGEFDAAKTNEVLRARLAESRKQLYPASTVPCPTER